MAEWKCENCGWTNSDKWDKCAKCSFPMEPTEEDRAYYKALAQQRQSEQTDASNISFEDAQIALLKNIVNFQSKQVDALKSINTKFNIIFAFYIIVFIIQIIAGIWYNW